MVQIPPGAAVEPPTFSSNSISFKCGIVLLRGIFTDDVKVKTNSIPCWAACGATALESTEWVKKYICGVYYGRCSPYFFAARLHFFLVKWR